MKPLFLLSLLFLSLSLFSAEIIGKVVGVSGGDTITVLDNLDKGAPAAEYRSGLFRSNPARSAQSVFAGLRLRRGIYIVSASGRLVHWSIHAGCAKTTPTPADCQPAGGDNKPLRRRIHG